MYTVCFLAAALLARLLFPRIRPEIPWICPVLIFALPFCVGGFHTGTAAVLAIALLAALLETVRRQGKLRFCRNLSSIAVLVLLAAYCLTPLWAADKGMAPFGIPRFLSLTLFALLLMQDDGEKITGWILKMLPGCGCLMIISSMALALIPGLAGYFTVNGRLAGFFQYPNSFGAFLLAGLILQSMENRGRWDLPVITVLMAGIILSGSRAVFVLTLGMLVLLLLVQRQKRLFFLFLPALVLGMGIGLLVDTLGLLHQADRFLTVSVTADTFLVRLLYYWDALFAIVSRPFGIGYLGYPAIQGSIQTCAYYVTFLHNGLLQLLLEAGWVPGLLLAFVLLQTLFRGSTAPCKRMLLLGILGHCMLDFDLQFPVFWILILCCLDLRTGKAFSLPIRKAGYAFALVLVAVSLWLGSSEWLYYRGRIDACLTLTPFHSHALEQRLTQSSDAAEVDALADKLLSLNPTHSLAYSAKANAAFARGDMLSMMAHKEAAIRCSPYTQAEYLDYFQKLYTAMELYRSAGDQASALYCRDKLLAVPAMMDTAIQKIPPLAYRLSNITVPTLPAQYTEVLNALKP